MNNHRKTDTRDPVNSHVSGGTIFGSTGGRGRGSAVNLTTDEKQSEPQKAEVIRRACAGGAGG